MSSVESSALASSLMQDAPMTDQELAEAAQKYKRSSWTGYFFPILPCERKRLSIMVCMFSTISFTYTFLRLFKDRVVYSVLDNVETKNWLKLLTFLTTQFLVIVSQNVSAKSDFNHAFRSLTMLFGGLLIVNTIFMWFSDTLQPNELFTDNLFVSNCLSVRGLKFLYPFVMIVNQYSFSCFYVLAEVIGSMMVSFCFMTYVNNNTSENQNKRFVKVLYFFSNISSYCAGMLYKLWNKAYKSSPRADVDKFYCIFPFSVVVLYTVVLGLKYILEREFQNQIVVSSGAPRKAGSKKGKIGFKDSLYLMFNSRFLLCMSGLSLFYNISANLLETANASGMAASAAYHNLDKSFYATNFKSIDSQVTSISTSLIIISPISSLPDIYGIALFAAVPLIISFVSTFIQLFFSVVNYPLTGYECMWPFNGFYSKTKFPNAESWFGTAIQSAIKISKYAFFDIVKEAISMKIDPTLRPLFKGVFDGSMAKFGKCAGSLYGIFMSMVFDAFDNRYYFPVTAFLMLVFCILWYFSIRYLSKAYNVASESGTYIDPDMDEKINF